MICSMKNEPMPPEGADWARPLFERQVAMLGQLAEAGLELALAIKDHALQAGADGDTALAYARASRAVRLTLMLQSQTIKQIQGLDSHAAYLTAYAASREQAERKAQVERIVERIAVRHHDDADEIERLVEEASERLDHDDLYGDILSRPVSDLVAMICRDLGLDPDWPSLAQEAWALNEIHNNQPFPPRGEVARDAPAPRDDGGNPTHAPQASPLPARGERSGEGSPIGLA